MDTDTPDTTRLSDESPKPLLTPDELANARGLFEDYLRHSLYWTDKFGSLLKWEEEGQNDLGYFGIRLCNDVDTLAAELSRVEAERDRYREALEFYACEDTYGMDMEGDGTPIPDSIVVLNDHGFIADLALNGGTDAE